MIQSCNQNNRPFQIFYPKASPPPYDSTGTVRDSTLPGGTKIYVVKKGSGHFQVVYQDEIRVQITGRTAGGKVFMNSCRSRDCVPGTRILYNLTPVPVPTRTGARYLIEGLRKGLLGMKEGEKRIIRIPPSKGFISTKFKHGIKVKGKTLIYDVKLIHIGR